MLSRHSTIWLRAKAQPPQFLWQITSVIPQFPQRIGRVNGRKEVERKEKALYYWGSWG
jgi:hypothetical protein